MSGDEDMRTDDVSVMRSEQPDIQAHRIDGAGHGPGAVRRHAAGRLRHGFLAPIPSTGPRFTSPRSRRSSRPTGSTMRASRGCRNGDSRRRVEEVRPDRQGGAVLPLCAQGADSRRLHELPGVEVGGDDHRLQALHRAEPGKPGCSLCAVSDGDVLLQPDPGRDARPGADPAGHRRLRAADPEISEVGICARRQGEAPGGGATSSPARR